MKYGAVLILAYLFAGCVSIITVGSKNKMTTQDNDGATHIQPIRRINK